MKITTPLAAAAIVFALAGCGGKAHSAAAKAEASLKARASAAAANPAYVRAERAALAKIQDCVKHVKVTRLIFHPVKGGAAVYSCATAGSKGVEKCWAHVANANGIGKGKLAADERGWAACVAAAKVKA